MLMTPTFISLTNTFPLDFGLYIQLPTQYFPYAYLTGISRLHVQNQTPAIHSSNLFLSTLSPCQEMEASSFQLLKLHQNLNHPQYPKVLI